MISINFRKICAKQEVWTLLNQVFNLPPDSICIEDANGDRVVGSSRSPSAKKYPVQFSETTIGWVLGEPEAASIPALLSYIVKQEFEKKSLAHELLERYQEIDLFQELSTQITASLDLKEVAGLAIEKVGELIESTSGSILLLDRTTDRLDPLSTFGQFPSSQPSLMLGKGMIGSIVQRGRGEIVNDVPSDPRSSPDDRQICALMCVPLTTKGHVMGAIAISSETRKTYTTEDLKILNIFASQTAIAIEKALLYQQSLDATQRAQMQAQQLRRTLKELQQTQAQLIQSEKMSSLGQMVAGVAHEINNPVNFIGGNLNHAGEYIQELLDLLQLYQQHYPQAEAEIQDRTEEIDLDFILEDLPKLLSSMGEGVNRINEIVCSLRNFSRLDQSKMKPIDLHEGLDSTLMMLQHRLKARGDFPKIQVTKEYGQLPFVNCSAGQLNQVFMNILSNAIDALEDRLKDRQQERVEKSLIPNPQIRICTQVLEENWVAIRIADNGPGIPGEVMKQIYDPFFTTKEVGKGTGLGMAISYQIVVEKHGGILRCLSQPGEGTEFWIQIPIAPLAGAFRDSPGLPVREDNPQLRAANQVKKCYSSPLVNKGTDLSQDSVAESFQIRSLAHLVPPHLCTVPLWKVICGKLKSMPVQTC